MQKYFFNKEGFEQILKRRRLKFSTFVELLLEYGEYNSVQSVYYRFQKPEDRLKLKDIYLIINVLNLEQKEVLEIFRYSEYKYEDFYPNIFIKGENFIWKHYYLYF